MAQATTTKLRPVPDRVLARPMAQAPTTKLRPLHDRVLVRRLEELDDKHGSIIIPDTAKEKPQEGKVMVVGTGRVTDEDYVLSLLRATGVLCVYGSGFGTRPEDGYFRVVFLASPPDLSSIFDDVAAFTHEFLSKH